MDNRVDNHATAGSVCYAEPQYASKKEANILLFLLAVVVVTTLVIAFIVAGGRGVLNVSIPLLFVTALTLGRIALPR